MRVNNSRLFDIGGQRSEICGDGEGVVSHAGVALLAALADRIGLTAALSERPRSRRQRTSAHDPGAVLRDVAVALADGGTCMSDLGVLRCQPELFGSVASHATVWRTLDRVAADELGGAEGIAAARNRARAQVWAQAGGPPLVEGMLVLDVDATIVAAESDKVGAAGTFKRTYGHHPLLCYLDHGDGTGDPLAGILRPGNAGSNTVDDHLDVLDAALAALPPIPEGTPMLLRADGAGATHGLVEALRAKQIFFSVGFDLTVKVRDAIADLDEAALADPTGPFRLPVHPHPCASPPENPPGGRHHPDPEWADPPSRRPEPRRDARTLAGTPTTPDLTVSDQCSPCVTPKARPHNLMNNLGMGHTMPQCREVKHR